MTASAGSKLLFNDTWRWRPSLSKVGGKGEGVNKPSFGKRPAEAGDPFEGGGKAA